MSTAQRIAKNTFVLIFADVLGKIFDFLYLFLAANFLGPSSYGILSFWIASYVLINFSTDLGIGTLTVRDVARDNWLARKYLASTIPLKATLIILCVSISFVIINYFGFSEQVRLTGYFIILSLIIKALNVGMFYPIFRAYEKMEYQAIGRFLSSCLVFFGAFFAIYNRYDVVGFALFQFLAYFLTLVYCILILLLKFFKPSIEIDWILCKQLIKEGLPFGLTNAFLLSINWIDTFILFFFVGSAALGWYTVAGNLTQPFILFPVMFGASVFPVMSRFYVTSRNSLKMVYEKLLKYIAILAFPLGVIITIYADEIIILLFGREYENSVIVLQIFAWVTVVIFLRSAFGKLLESSNEQLMLTKISGICMIENIILSIILIHNYSYIGAGVSRFLTVLTHLILYVLASHKLSYGGVNRNTLSDFVKIIIASLLMAIFAVLTQILNLFPSSILGLVFSVSLTMLIYLIALFLFKEFDRDEWNLIFSLLKLESYNKRIKEN